jgi:hypothetical protein
MRDREKRLAGELTIRREAVQFLSKQHYPAKAAQAPAGSQAHNRSTTYYRYQGPTDLAPPPSSGQYVCRGQIDPRVVRRSRQHHHHRSTHSSPPTLSLSLSRSLALCPLCVPPRQRG